MDSDKYYSNGIDYDPDLIYPQQESSQGARRPSRQQTSRYDESPAPAEAPRRKRQRATTPPADVERMARRGEEDSRMRRDSRRYDDERRDERERMERDHSERIERARMREKAETERRERLASERRVRDAERAAEKAARKAEREAARKDRKPISEWGITKFLLDKRTHAVCGVALIGVAVYLLIAAISFMKVGGSDQSMVSSLTVQQITSTGSKVENTGGPVGATVAQMIFAQGLGLGSLTAIVYLALLGLGLMGIKKVNFWSMTFKALLVAVSISIVAGFIGLWFNSDFLYGGIHGLYVNEFLVKNVEWIGAALVSILLVVAVVYLYLNDLITVYNKYQAIQKARKEKAEQMRLEREEAQARVKAAMEQSQLDNGDEIEENVESETPSEPSVPREQISLGFDEEISDKVDEYAIIPGANSTDGMQPVANEEAIVAHTIEDNTPEQTVESPVAVPAAEHMANESIISDVEPNIEESEASRNDSYSHDSEQSASDKTAEEKEIEEEESEEPKVGFEVTSNTIEKADHIAADVPYDPTSELSFYRRPALELLNEVDVKTDNIDMLEQEANKERLIEVLRQYMIEISSIEAIVGPTVTLYKIVPAEGIRISRIKGLEDDIAMALAATGIRIIAPIPGESNVGIEVPNKQKQTVSIRSVLSSKAFQESKAELPMAMGATISNEVFVADLTKMPHLLVAGATGMGKSVGLNTIIASLIYKKHPAELKFVLIDPKRVEFANYASLEKHFLAKLPDDEDAIVTNMDNVVNTLTSLCIEMERRYDLLKDAHVVKVTKYNELFIQKKLNPEKGHRYLPYIVVIIDEFADLIMTAGKQVETPIARIAQMARAVGIHMIIATQRPSTNVITGLIKANFPGRVAFRVNQMVDSRTILDCPGANQLNGMGDMLFSVNGVMERVQCAFIDTPEVHRICDFIDAQAGFEHPYFLPEPLGDDAGSNGGSGSGSRGGSPNGERDPLFEEVARYVVQSGNASTSSVQRTWRIGYNRAGSIMDQLEAAGIVGPATGGKARSVLVDALQLGSLISLTDD